MNFFFEKWKQERHYDSFGQIENIEHSTHFTVDGVPFFATFGFIDDDIYIYHEPEHSEVAVICNVFHEARTNHIEFDIQNYFKDAIALVDLIRNEKLKHMEEA